MYIRIWVIARSLDWEREGRKESILGYNFLVYNFAASVGRKMVLCTVSVYAGALHIISPSILVCPLRPASKQSETRKLDFREK